MNRVVSANQGFKPPGVVAKSEQSASQAMQMPASLPAENGFDLTLVPVRPLLHTAPRIQCCAADGGGCSCPKCQEAASEKEFQENDEEGISEIGEAVSGGSGVSEVASDEGAVSEAASEGSGASETASGGGDVSGVSSEESAVSEAGGSASGGSAVSEAAPGQSGPGAEPEVSVSPLSPEGAGDTAATADHTSPNLIVDDSTSELHTGQMKKMQFLQQLREGICNGIDPVLAQAGRSSEGCPYLNYWLGLYQQKDAAHIEQAARKYAPGTAGAKTAEEYISMIVERAVRAAEIWVTTGKLSGVPEGVPTTIPGQPAPENAGGGMRVQAKARDGGMKKADDPQAIQEELGSGQPLPADVRERMESVFGTSFAHVKTHTDATAAQVSDRVNARAFTVGNHVAFGNGEYQPGTMLGDALIAHELAHVIQQDSPGGTVAGDGTGDGNYDALERDADRSAASTIASLWHRSASSLGNIAQNAIPRMRSGLRLQRCGGDSKPKPPPGPAGPCKPTLKSMAAAKTGTIAMTTAWSGNCEMAFGSPSAAGMTTTAEVDVPAGCTGKLELVQLVKTCRQYTNPPAAAGGADTDTRLKSTDYVLDTTDPYASQNVTAAGSATITTNDSPGDQTVGRKKIFVTDNFKIWLMWTPAAPAGSPRVPIAMAQWNWTAKAADNGGGGCAAGWAISGDSASGGAGTATNTSPTWTDNVTSLTEEAGTCP
ncbi:MAG TPA: DUF4157 domain-containing protein [Puia sp.]|nr:DUF4157 domain-containing protein [Puia sp.]